MSIEQSKDPQIVEHALRLVSDPEDALDTLIGAVARFSHILKRDREKVFELLALNYAQIDGDWTRPEEPNAQEE